MSPQKLTETQEAPVPTGSYRKPKPDLYTVFLVIALIAVLIGILFLYLEMNLYEFKLQGGPMVMVRDQGVGIRGQGSEVGEQSLGVRKFGDREEQTAITVQYGPSFVVAARQFIVPDFLRASGPFTNASTS